MPKQLKSELNVKGSFKVTQPGQRWGPGLMFLERRHWAPRYLQQLGKAPPSFRAAVILKLTVSTRDSMAHAPGGLCILARDCFPRGHFSEHANVKSVSLASTLNCCADPPPALKITRYQPASYLDCH